jgi:uncharacterized protein YbbC (DUF1343 family)
MEACREQETEVVVLDRPNPLGGKELGGTLLEPAFASFVGRYPLPMQHGMTLGELAQMAHQSWGLDCRLRVVPMRGWRREMNFAATGLPWVLPSPNLPDPETAMIYPGMVLLEGTNLSEGRGTVRPFSIFGHPKLEPYGLAGSLNRHLHDAGYAGFVLRPTTFTPTFHKFAGQSCGGFQLHLTAPSRFRPWRFGLSLIQALSREMRTDFAWRQPPFEYEYERLPFDLLNGSSYPREWVEQGGDQATLVQIEADACAQFLARRETCLYYA